MEDRVSLYNFLSQRPEYLANFEAYKKDFTSHITSLEDFMEIYMHIDDEELRGKAKEAIETLTGHPL